MQKKLLLGSPGVLGLYYAVSLQSFGNPVRYSKECQQLEAEMIPAAGYSPKVAYSPKKDDLFFPCKNAQFFPSGAPNQDHALCVELARLAYCRSSSNFAFDQARIQRELNRVQFDAGGFFESPSTALDDGTHAFLAVRQDKQLAVVSFRGTDKNDPTDIADDVDAIPIPWQKGGKVHQGFAGALADVRQELLKSLQTLNCRLLFTGHSLGAALATLLASLRAADALYTFGSPLVGDADFVATLAGLKNYRYVDCCDIVTRVPPEELGYRHLGAPYYIAQDRSIQFNPVDAFVQSDRLKAFLEYPFKYAAWRAENVGVRELADHAPVNYVTAVSASPAP